MKPIKHSCILNGLKATYYRCGQGNPLLFLHGGRLSALAFKHSLKLLATHYTVIAPDIPGYGASDTPKETWSYADYAEFFESFLDKLDLHEVKLVGYSMGGGIASNLAASSNRISSLVLVDSSGLRKSSGGSFLTDLKRLAFYVVHPQYFRTFLMLTKEAIQFTWKHRYDRAHIQQIRRACAGTSYEIALRRISIPTKLVWGKEDAAIPLTTAAAFQKLIPQAQLEVVSGTHDWPLYNHLLFSKLMV